MCTALRSSRVVGKDGASLILQWGSAAAGDAAGLPTCTQGDCYRRVAALDLRLRR